MKNESMNPRVSVIILNWNGALCIGKCLDSIAKCDYPKDKLEVIVVDNASTDHSLNIVRTYPHIVILENQVNLGFCEGNNVGLRFAKGDILVLLNYDCYVSPGWLTHLARHLSKDRTIGVAGSEIRFLDGGIQAAGFIIDRYGRSIPIDESKRDSSGDLASVDGNVDCVSGASVAIRREALYSVGLLDPFIFAYYDMPDFCLRVRSAGYRVVIVPSSLVYHISAHGWRRRTILQQFLLTRNRVYFLVKHHRGGLRTLLWGEVAILLDKLLAVASGRATFQRTGLIGGMAEVPSTLPEIAKATLDFAAGKLLTYTWFLAIGAYSISRRLRAADSERFSC